ncbi:ABC transporter ATP-binding protein [Pseudomonas sp. JDS28PS106]|uniref:ABC transporter ATP-binding protein n=1 Tax=Pseudomonas sp. JDS28PS106 TaxID=2497235 RepID=UPI002FD7684F
MLSLRDVHKTRGTGQQGYRLVVPHLELLAGRHYALIGPSGCGKSTLLDLLALVLAPDRAQRFDFSTADGEFDVGGLWRKGDQDRLARLRSRHLGYVLQTGGLLGYLDVQTNIALPRKLLGLAEDGSVERLAGQLGIGEQLRKKPAALSVGQRQRVSCARALAHGPQLVLADEPTAALDPLNAGRVMNLLLEQAGRQRACCVIATHDEALVRDAGLEILRLACERDAQGGVVATLEARR